MRVLGRFARNRRVRSVKKRLIDIQCLTIDADIRREVAAVVAKQLRERPTNRESVDETKNEFTDAIVRTAELVIPRKKQKRVGRGWSGDAQTQSELEKVETEMYLSLIHI